MNNTEKEPTVDESMQLIKNAVQQLQLRWAEHLVISRALMIIDKELKRGQTKLDDLEQI